MQTRQSSVRQSVSQSVRLEGRQAARQSASTTVCQSIMHSISASFTYFICRFIRQSSCSMSPASCIFQDSQDSVNLMPVSICLPSHAHAHAQLEPPLQTAAAAGAAATKVNQMSAEPPLRFTGADVVCHFGANVIPNTQTQTFPLPSPLPCSILPSLMTPDSMQMSPSFQAKSAKTSTTFRLNIF